jgi:hypothetical protein
VKQLFQTRQTQGFLFAYRTLHKTDFSRLGKLGKIGAVKMGKLGFWIGLKSKRVVFYNSHVSTLISLKLASLTWALPWVYPPCFQALIWLRSVHLT